jgi:hypothetical protein
VIYESTHAKETNSHNDIREITDSIDVNMNIGIHDLIHSIDQKTHIDIHESMNKATMRRLSAPEKLPSSERDSGDNRPT